MRKLRPTAVSTWFVTTGAQKLLLCALVGNVPLNPKYTRTDLPKAKQVSLKGQKQATNTLLCSLGTWTAGATPGREPRHGAPEACGNPRGPYRGLLAVVVCSCFPQDTSLMTQITARGRENEDHFLPKTPSFFRRYPVAETEERLAEHGAEGRGM